MDNKKQAMNAFIDLPIDPEGLHEQVWSATATPDLFAKAHPNLIVREQWIKSEVFAAILEVTRYILEGLQWNRKSRLIIEYDPAIAKFAVVAVREADGTNPPEADPADADLPHQ